MPHIIFSLSEHILDHKGLDLSTLDKTRSESYTQQFDLIPLDPRQLDERRTLRALRPLGAAYIPILLSVVEQEQRPSGNEDCGGGHLDRTNLREYTICH